MWPDSRQAQCLCVQRHQFLSTSLYSSSFFLFFPFIFLLILYSWKISRSLNTKVPQVHFQKAGGAVQPHRYHTWCPPFHSVLGHCETGPVQLFCKTSAWMVWAVQQSQTATSDTSEIQLLKTLTSPFLLQKKSPGGKKRISIGVKKANNAEIDVVLPWLLCCLGCCFIEYRLARFLKWISFSRKIQWRIDL